MGYRLADPFNRFRCIGRYEQNILHQQQYIQQQQQQEQQQLLIQQQLQLQQQQQQQQQGHVGDNENTVIETNLTDQKRWQKFLWNSTQKFCKKEVPVLSLPKATHYNNSNNNINNINKHQ
eukprot:Pgem_evm1s13901